MTELSEELIRSRRKRAIRLAAAIFAGCLIIFTFYSNTYQSLTLPKVSVEQPEVGQLSYEIEGEGNVAPKRTIPLYHQSGWPVAQVQIQEGELVKKGQTLLTFDTSQAEKSLADEEDRLAKQRLELEKLEKALTRNGIGGETAALEETMRQIAALKLDMSIQSRKVESIRQEIARNGTLAAPFDGLVAVLEADEGVIPSQGKAVVQLSDLSRGWELEAAVEAEAAGQLAVGEVLDVRIRAGESRYVKGTVSAIGNEGLAGGQTAGGSSGTKQVTLDIADDKLSGGEPAEFSLTRKVGMPRMLVPLSAIKTDAQGEYLLVVRETKRPLGNEMKAVKQYVRTESADATKAAVSGAVNKNDKIIVEASQPVSDGDPVRLN